MGKLRVIVIEDSMTVRSRIIEILSSDSEIEVVGETGDGRIGIELVGKLRPDVITLDMALGESSGLEVTEHVMAHFPTPILIVSASINRAELFQTWEALSAGALDILEKSKGDESDGEWAGKLISTVKLISRIKVITHPRGRLRAFERKPITLPPIADIHPPSALRVVAIGASTGGPGAIVEILRAVPPDFVPPILFVLHIGEPFGTVFAEWLSGMTPHEVQYARDGESLAQVAGKVMMAPPDRHLVVRQGKLQLTSDPPLHSCRPSVDILFESIARECKHHAVGCLLTGMGRDGAEGLLRIRQAGGLTLAQDEATSVVYGMPREAALLGAADRVLPLNRIADTLAALTTRRKEARP